MSYDPIATYGTISTDSSYLVFYLNINKTIRYIQIKSEGQN
ncbi:hypothetical protein [Bacillus sp. 166amftsu]|nr:hypothetical protein [Bacillus sp. 166amftsu]